MVTDPAQALLLTHMQPSEDDHILILEGGDGRLAQAIASRVPRGNVLSLSRDVRDIWDARNRLDDLPNAGTDYHVLPSKNGWDIILMVIPKERRYARTLLLAAKDVLKPGGRLLLAGATRKGAKAIIKDAERLFGEITILGYRNHQRVAACTHRAFALPSPPEEFQQIGVTPGTTHTIRVDGPYGSLILETHPGIFSWEKLDSGSALLLDYLGVKPGTHVWDVGCGYGVIGFTAALAGAATVTMTDINLLAIDYTKRNAARNRLSDRVWVYPADGLKPPPQYPPDISLLSIPRFDLIISNPAFHQGHQVDKSMAGELIARAPEFLAPKGRLIIVANRFLNYDRYMRSYFSRVIRIAETNKFHLLLGTNH
jgi:16S rRNA (guanine1207-N2)-methyltransferase